MVKVKAYYVEYMIIIFFDAYNSVIVFEKSKDNHFLNWLCRIYIRSKFYIAEW